MLIKKIQPYAARLISSNGVLRTKRRLAECKRRLLKQPHKLDVYIRINDPYSYVLVQVLADFQKRFNVNIQVRTILKLQDDMYPEAEMWHENAFIDATHLAELYSLKIPQQPPKPDPNRVKEGTDQLLILEQFNLESGVSEQSNNWVKINEIFDRYWFPQAMCDERQVYDAAALAQRLISNELMLAEQGHYMSAMLKYAGEWYWGIDRLDHLEKRLNTLGVQYDKTQSEIVFNKTYIDFCQQSPIESLQLNDGMQTSKKLALFFSIRSPYSHIGLEQAIKLAQHYDLDLEIKPILPMIMRGLSVPSLKKMYIFHDTKREAEKLGIDYGFVADPLGRGVENCYALFCYAQSLGCEQSYLLNYARAVNAQGIHSEADNGLKVIVQRSGMDWEYAKTLLNDHNAEAEWKLWAEENRQEMLALGSWGVPTFQYGDLVLWGQDRIGMIEREIKKTILIDNV
jgi:2-hydroxychromene-2-carboxylate isomerase